MSKIRKPPKDGIRGHLPGVEFRAADGEGASPTMFGHFAVFDRWTEIDSFWEGTFLERLAAGAFKKTFRDGGQKVLFQHGMDPQIGDKPLGPINSLREDDEGAYYEVPLLDAPYVRENVLPGLEAGLYGASFRFRVIREEWAEEPDPSDTNPKGLPERTIKEAQVSEFGPVTFPAYPDATAGVRSLTDDFIMRCMARDPERLREMFDRARSLNADTAGEGDLVDAGEQDTEPGDEPAAEQDNHAPPQGRAETLSHPDRGRRDKPNGLYGLKPKETSWRL